MSSDAPSTPLRLSDRPPGGHDPGLDRVLDELVGSYHGPEALNDLQSCALPNRRAAIRAFVDLQHLIFATFFTTRQLTSATLRLALSEHLLSAHEALVQQIERAVMWTDRLLPEDRRRGRAFAERVTHDLLHRLPEIRRKLHGDVRAAYTGDPAAESLEEIVFSYPGVLAMTAYRVAHELFRAGVPMIPRIISEHAHSRTGIDIHPGATIGERCFIDHGTGVVVGATSHIGDDVKLYQGVTLGALSVRRDAPDPVTGNPKKRHPTLHDRVTVYAGATILGGETVIGTGATIGGNVWLIRSVPPHSKVYRRGAVVDVSREPKVQPRGAPMDIKKDVVEAIGNTPLIRLHRLSEETGCEILGKAEWLNPGMSVKDRAAKYMVLDAEERGVLRPGGIIVEGTAGNTGIGLALVGRARGYRVVIVIPETQSQEKKDMLRLAGAELVQVPAVPFANPNNYVHVAERLAEQLARTSPGGAFYANQWDNLANRRAHLEGTGPEIWSQAGGRVDGFVSAIGTGGTLSGVGMYLKDKDPEVTVALADPYGAKMFAWFTRGELEVDVEGGSITQGIGQGRVTGNVDGSPVDRAYRIPDAEAVALIDRLAQEEGIVVGGSAGVNVAGAVRLARELGPGHTIVTILCDHGSRYQSQLFNADFRRSKGLPVCEWLEQESEIEPPFVPAPE